MGDDISHYDICPPFARCTQEGKTALILASEEGYLEVVFLLVAAGADVNAHDDLVGWVYTRGRPYN